MIRASYGLVHVTYTWLDRNRIRHVVIDPTKLVPRYIEHATWPVPETIEPCDARFPLGPPSGGGWQPLFDGTDFSQWKLPKRSRGHWTVIDGVIDYDARSGTLWTKRSFGDFALQLDWRLKSVRGKYPMRLIEPDGSEKRDAAGKVIRIPTPNADSGIFLRGLENAQVNIWCWPSGSGEVYGFRTNPRMPPHVRAACVPKTNADNNVGEWNRYQITMTGDRLTVVLNGKLVIEDAQLPGIPATGPIGLQHHGGFNRRKGEYGSASALIQFRNIYIRPLRGE